jgi:flagellar protein FlaG
MEVSATAQTGDAIKAATLYGSGSNSLHAYQTNQQKSQDDAVTLSGAAALMSGTPVQNAQALHQAPPVSAGNSAQQAVTEINAVLKRFATTLQFTVDPATLTRVVKVVDSDTGETVRQMPTEDAIKAAHALDQGKGLLIGQKV